MPPLNRDKDPWNRSFVSPTPSPTSFSDTDVIIPENGFINLSRDSDLANELDLRRREDNAVVKETLFTLAKLRAQQKASRGHAARDKDGRRMGGSIRTADGTDDPPSSSAKASGSLSTSAQKKRRIASTGWTNCEGEPLAAGPLSKSKNPSRGSSEQVTARSSKPARKVAPKDDQASGKGTRKPKKKKVDDEKVEFRRLPVVTPESNFPIIAALERQRSLPPKRKVAKKVAPAAPRAPPKPRQTQLDIEALVGGYKAQEKKRRPSKLPSFISDSSGLPDLAEALEEAEARDPSPKPMASSSRIPPRAKPFAPAPSPSSRATAQAKLFTPAPLSTCSSPSRWAKPYTSAATLPSRLSPPIEQGPEFIDLRHSLPEPSQTLDRAAAMPRQTQLFRPVPQRAENAVQLLESLADKHTFLPAALKKATSMRRHSQHQVPIQDTDHTFQDPECDMVSPPRRGLDGFIHSRPLNNDDGDSNHGSFRLASAVPPFDEDEAGHARGGGLHLPDATWPPMADEDGLEGPEWDAEQGHPTDRFEDGQGQMGNGHTGVGDQRQVWHGNGPSSQDNGGEHGRHELHDAPDPTRLHTFERPTFDADEFFKHPSTSRAPHQRASPPPAGYSPIIDPRVRSDPRMPTTPASAYTETKRRERLPLKGSWHEVLGSPTPPAGWSTLPPKRKNRITIRPEATQPKSSRFQLPMNLFSKPQTSQPSQRGQPSSSRLSPALSTIEPSLFTGPVTITKWTPTALGQPPSHARVIERDSGRTRYVLPNLRALDQAQAGERSSSSTSSRDYHQAQRSHHDPTHATHVAHHPQLAQRGTNPYPTPRSLALPTLSGQAATVNGEDDDWASAWKLSSNAKSRGETEVGAAGF